MWGWDAGGVMQCGGVQQLWGEVQVECVGRWMEVNAGGVWGVWRWDAGGGRWNAGGVWGVSAVGDGGGMQCRWSEGCVEGGVRCRWE